MNNTTLSIHSPSFLLLHFIPCGNLLPWSLYLVKFDHKKKNTVWNSLCEHPNEQSDHFPSNCTVPIPSLFLSTQYESSVCTRKKSNKKDNLHFYDSGNICHIPWSHSNLIIHQEQQKKQHLCRIFSAKFQCDLYAVSKTSSSRCSNTFCMDTTSVHKTLDAIFHPDAFTALSQSVRLCSNHLKLIIRQCSLRHAHIKHTQRSHWALFFLWITLLRGSCCGFSLISVWKSRDYLSRRSFKS